LQGGAGDDSIYITAGNTATLVRQTVDGGADSDTLVVNYNAQTILHYGWFTLVTYNSANGPLSMTLDASTTAGIITAGTNQVKFEHIEKLYITGTNDEDIITGGNGNDILSGGFGGNDSLSGGRGDDGLSNQELGIGNTVTLNGDDGNDILQNHQAYASKDTAVLNGGAGDDTLANLPDYWWVGGVFNCNDTVALNGGDGNDTLKNESSYGNVTLTGGAGNDTLTGGGGADKFFFNNFSEGIDTITNFTVASDIIDISAAGFGGGLVAGALDASQFFVGTAASDANDLFIYDNTTGALYFDQDGNNAGFTQVEIVGLASGLSLSANDFVIA
jgi:Ca2+-binding RTX toxin-like protein